MKKFKIGMLMLIIVAMAVSVCACVGDENMKTIIPFGVYELVSYKADGLDLTNQYAIDYIELSKGMEFTHKSVDFYGYVNNEGKYTETNNSLIAKVGKREYTYAYNASNGELSFSGKLNGLKVESKYKRNDKYVKDTSKGEKLFTEELFGENKATSNFYNYCPTIKTEGNDTIHIWYCSNQDSGNITDFVAYRKGTLKGDGKWSFTDKELVLSPTQDTWDSRHTCDPSVVKGKFALNGENYPYLMAYLGCRTSNNMDNEVGIAVSKTPIGPWIKVENLNPIAKYINSEDFPSSGKYWGYGQPSLVSVDKAGKVILFYTKGVSSTYTFAEFWDLSDLNNAKKLESVAISINGSMNAAGTQSIINNADFAYDPYNKRIYVTTTVHPFDREQPNFISSAEHIMYINMEQTDTYVGETLLGNKYRWNNVGYIDVGVSGFKRNHNSGLLTDEYGWITNPFKIAAVYTVSCLDSEGDGRLSPWPSLHSYRLYGCYFNVVD